MTRDIETQEEKRDELIADLTQKRVQARMEQFLDGDKRVINDVCNSVLDYMANTDDCMLDLLVKALSSERAVTGKEFEDVVLKVMRDEAECDAIREVERMEQARKESEDEGRIARAEFDRAMSQ